MKELKLTTDILDYFVDKGFEYIDVPWLISKSTEKLTLPSDRLSNSFVEKDVTFVGSAEQGFLELYLKDKIEKNKDYVSFSPCVRLNDNQTIYSKETFYKVELSAIVEDYQTAIQTFHRFKEYSKALFLSVTNRRAREDIISTSQIDLFILNDNNEEIEVGSYGFRRLTDGNYLIFGTGAALYRLSLLHKETGYHKQGIVKGELGELSKLKEELRELEDAISQDDKILQSCELSDLIGAIEEYSKYKLGLTLDDLIKFSKKNKNAFLSGKR